MGLFDFFKPKSEWQSLIDGAKPAYRAWIEDFVATMLIPDEIDKGAFGINFTILSKGGFKMAEAFLAFEENGKELLRRRTKSIGSIDKLGGVGLGFSDMFTAAYPDVILWFNKLSDKEQEIVTGEILETDWQDSTGWITPKYLRRLVDEFKRRGNKLEVSKGFLSTLG